MNIVDPILFQCRLNTPAPAISAPGTALNVLSYGRLERFIHNISRKAVSAGLTAGQTIAILAEDKLFHAALIFGLTRLGIVTLSARGPVLPKEIGIDALITDKVVRAENAARVIVADLSWTEGDGTPLADARLYRGSGDDVCRIVLTSGSTGAPKGVAFTHRMLADRIGRYAFAKGNRFPHARRLYCDLGMSTSPGFRYMLYMLWKGGTAFFYGHSPEDTVQAFDLYRIESMIASPDGLQGFLRFYESYPQIQSSFDHIISSGGLLTKPLSERVRARLCANLISSYGSTEVGTVASAPAHMLADTPGGVGFVTPGVTVEIAGADGRALPPGKDGSVRIRGPDNASGYVADTEESARVFRDGWFYPGDVGHLTADGMLVLSGRERNVLNIGGDKVRPELVEEALAAFEAVEQAAVCALPNTFGIDELCALIVPRAPIDETALKAHCARALSAGFVPAHFVMVDSLPRGDMGKLERPRLIDLARLKIQQNRR
jgi:acyl-CoA synthetase (AMP-forming)/AMP-acid ligase II